MMKTLLISLLMSANAFAQIALPGSSTGTLTMKLPGASYYSFNTNGFSGLIIKDNYSQYTVINKPAFYVLATKKIAYMDAASQSIAIANATGLCYLLGKTLKNYTFENSDTYGTGYHLLMTNFGTTYNIIIGGKIRLSTVYCSI